MEARDEKWEVRNYKKLEVGSGKIKMEK